MASAVTAFAQENLVSSRAADGAQMLDPAFINAWGMAIRPAGFGGHWWIANTDTSRVTLYVGDSPSVPFTQDGLSVLGVPGAPGNDVVTITIDPPTENGVARPPPNPTPATLMPASNPTGQVFSGSTTDFLVSGTSLTGAAINNAPARFITVSEDGTIAAWGEFGSSPAQRMDAFQVVIDNSASGAIYKGVTVSAETGSGNLLYAANFSQNAIEVYDALWQPVATSGFVLTDAPGDRDPAEFAPFNIERVFDSSRGEEVLIAAYARVADASAGEEESTDGFVVKFTLDGDVLGMSDAAGHFNAPWGVALAPGEWGGFDGDLLVGNFGDGRILALDMDTLQFDGFLLDQSGLPIEIDGLWDLIFGNGASLGATDKLYFSAGPEEETHGLFGSLALSFATILKTELIVTNEEGGSPPGSTQGGDPLPVAALGLVANTAIDLFGRTWARAEYQGLWGGLKNVALDHYDADWGEAILVANFTDTRLDFSDAGAADLSVTVVGSRRGDIQTADGNDTIEWYFHSPGRSFVETATIDGGAGNEVVRGGTVALTSLDEILLGDNPVPGNGPQWSGAYDGRFSTLEADLGAGDDTAEATDVRLVAGGGDGADRLTGGTRDDALSGDGGDDRINGRAGDDALVGGAGRDNIQSAEGDDSIAGGENDDVLLGQAGGGTIHGEAGSDFIDGGSEADALDGGAGNDVLYGGSGSDRLAGGGGLDTLFGGEDADWFVLAASAADRDWIKDFRSGTDVLEIGAALFGGGLAPGALPAARLVAGASATEPGVGQFLFDAASGVLRWDQDGAGGAATVTVATLVGVASLAATDVMVV